MNHLITAIMVAILVLPVPVMAQTTGKAKPAAKQAAPIEKPAPAPPIQPPAPAPINILSIIPAQGEPRMTVTLYGTGFTENTSVFLGNMEIPADVVGPQQLSFDIPKLAPGLYALFLKRDDNTTSRIYNFTVQPPKPVADSLSPDTVHFCASGSERDVVISGRNFQEKSQVLFDGSIIRSRYGSPETLTFSVPQVAGGLHQVQVKNAEDTVTTALGLFINAKPEIGSISRGEGMVNYYNLVIEGKNFQQGASIMVDEKTFQVGAAAFGGKKLTTGGSNSGERERIIFVDCTKLIYQRHPTDPADKDLRIQVINPNNEASSIVQVTAP